MPAQLDRAAVSMRPGRALARLLAYGLFEGRPVTTRGRWINPLVRSVLRSAGALNLRGPARPPLFLVGQGRSGTTLLGKLFALHSDVGFLNEPKLLWTLVHPDFDVHGDYTSSGGRLRIEPDELDATARKRARSMYQAFLMASRSKRVFDKYLDLLYRVPAVRAIFPDARFVFLIRDGNEVTRSVAVWNERFGRNVRGERHDWWGVNDRKWRCLIEEIAPVTLSDAELEEVASLSTQRQRGALEWILAAREGAKLTQSFPDSVLTLRYESLVLDPCETLRALFEFFGLPSDEAVVRYAVERVRPRPEADEPQLPSSLLAAYRSLREDFAYA